MSTRLILQILCVTFALALSANSRLVAQEVERAEMAGYLLIPNDKVPQSYNAGFSMYVAAWPLLDEYPGRRFQTGLLSTWMFAQYEEGQKPKQKVYSDIEGGLGWWRDTRFATETPKFIMGGVARNFSAWANGPGAGKGRDWSKPQGKYGVAQLSPNVLWPPDGLNLKQGTCGELFGYGYLPLPLTEPKTTTEGEEVPTGNQCWTLFVNSGNFKGPVAFFTPYFFSKVALKDKTVAGLFLDTRPSQPNRALQMETQYVPAFQAKDAKGDTYARIAPTSFPSNTDGDSVVVHKVSSYNRTALWDAVESWFAGGEAPRGTIDPDSAAIHNFPGRGGATWRIYEPGTERDDKVRIDWSSFVSPHAFDSQTFGYQWDDKAARQRETEDGRLVTAPEYFRLIPNEEVRKSKWVVVSPDDVPSETGLAKVEFKRPTERRGRRRDEGPYVTPAEADSCWKTPGPVAGPFHAFPGDGSKVTYYWYRFADQPAMLNADLTDDEREAVQTRVEMIHQNWKSDREYLPPPEVGELADIDPAMLVTPPEGLEVGYVPIVTRQEKAE